MSSTKPICSISSPSSSTRNLRLLERERAALHVIQHAAGGADDDVRAALQALELRRVALPAVDGQHVEARHLRGVFLECFGHLDGELARGREDQRLRGAQLHVDLREDGQRERRRLAGAGLRLAEQVGATEDDRDGLRLDGRGRLVAHVVARRRRRRRSSPSSAKLGRGCRLQTWELRCRVRPVPISEEGRAMYAECAVTGTGFSAGAASASCAAARDCSLGARRARPARAAFRRFRPPASPDPRSRPRSGVSSGNSPGRRYSKRLS